MHTYKRIYTHTYKHTCTHTPIYIYIHTHTHIHIHTYKFNRFGIATKHRLFTGLTLKIKAKNIDNLAVVRPS